MFGLDKQSRLNRKLIAAVKEGNVTAVGELLGKGASVEARSKSYWGMTVLSIASHIGHLAVVKLLLDKGADINAHDSDGDTPLMNAVRKGHEKVLAELQERGADKTLVNNKGERVADVALGLGKTRLYPLLGIAVVEETKPAPAPVKEPARVESTDEVVLFRPFGNRLLEETFNFVARERITLLRNGMDGPVEAMTREGFDTISDKAALRYAFELYKSKGGKRSESEIFPDALGKISTLPGRQP